MPRKSSPSMLPRFKGNSQLIEALCTQTLAAGDRRIAELFAKYGTLEEFPAGQEVIRQGDPDNYLLLIVTGSVSIAINGRLVGTRQSGQHIGELALIDQTSRRSATATTQELCVLLKIEERDVTRIGKRHPDLWRRIAVTIGARLRERSDLIKAPHTKPVVFIGSSRESANTAEWISNSLNRREFVSRLWTQGVFQISQTAIEDLTKQASESDFAALLLTPDDMTASRGKRLASPRDNVVFELGLFMGALGRDRTFLVTARGTELKLPTDLLGMTRVEFKAGGRKTLGTRLGPVTRTIARRIVDIGAK